MFLTLGGHWLGHQIHTISSWLRMSHHCLCYLPDIRPFLTFKIQMIRIYDHHTFATQVTFTQFKTLSIAIVTCAIRTRLIGYWGRSQLLRACGSLTFLCPVSAPQSKNTHHICSSTSLATQERTLLGHLYRLLCVSGIVDISHALEYLSGGFLW